MYRNEHEANIGREEAEELWREKEEEERLMIQVYVGRMKCCGAIRAAVVKGRESVDDLTSMIDAGLIVSIAPGPVSVPEKCVCSEIAALPAAPVVDGELVAQCEAALKAEEAHQEAVEQMKESPNKGELWRQMYALQARALDLRSAALIAIARSRGRE